MRYTCSDLGANQMLDLAAAIARLPEQLRPGHVGRIVAETTDADPLPAVAIDYQVSPTGVIELDYAFSANIDPAERHAWEKALAPYLDA